MVEIQLALGSNLGDRERSLRLAVEALATIVAVREVSPVFETAPAYVLDQPAFLNMALAAETDLAPERLLVELKAIEDRLGRRAGRRFGPRAIDLDILFYGDSIIESPILEIPHPRMAERAFVLVPLAYVAADKRHPATGRTVRQMLQALSLESQGIKPYSAA